MADLKQYRIRAGSAAELVREVEAAVAEGVLSPGDRLPSVRHLAGEVGLSPVTVSAGLAELRRRGVVVTEPRRGTRIGHRPPIGTRRARLPAPEGARDVSLGNPDAALLPDLAAVLARVPAPSRLYGAAPVIPELAAAAREQLRADGIPAEALCVLGGAMDAIERVLQAHLRAGDRVAVESPGYADMFDLLRAQGLVLEPVAIDDRGMRPQELGHALARGAAAVVITPRGQNPTGAALDAARAADLRAVLAGHPGVLVIEDDHLGPVAGHDLHSTIEDRERWAAVRSMAKALGPDVRLAVLAADAATVARVEGRQQCGPGWVSYILQSLVLELWRDPAVSELTARAGATYTVRRERLIASLARRGISAHGVSGLNVWIPVTDEAGVLAALLQRGWVVAPGAVYRLGAEQPAVRVTSATMSESDAELFASALAEVLALSRPARSG